ncbi:unnamed protein product [Plutella xylostella]|uniref:Lipase n=1 Tax=Plutella xylostella TaxID=51655 RepID=A0A8S4FL49_PLUXY|nr:unnamed protein product [Plutella xylostella]
MTIIVKCVCLVLVISFQTWNFTEAQAVNSRAFATATQLISDAGYPVEKHRVHTEDGYILQMHRIPAGRRSARRTSQKGKKAVLIAHGLFGSSGDFVIMGPQRSLGYILADAGFDVWIANFRGTMYSSHKTLPKSDAQFWDFSFHEHGKYDLPATIDKILSVTGLQKVMYIGYSMGSSSFFAMTDMRPEYNDKIVASINMAPGIYIEPSKDLFTFLLKTIKMPDLMRAQGVHYMNLPSNMRDILINTICTVKRDEDDLCMKVAQLFAGDDPEQIDKDVTPKILARFQPASWKQLEHYGKLAITGVFSSLDGGLDTPGKIYDLKKCRVPVVIIYGNNDRLTPKAESIRLAQELNATGMLDEVTPVANWPKFNHLDFEFAKDVGNVLNKPLVRTIHNLFNKYDAL